MSKAPPGTEIDPHHPEANRRGRPKGVPNKSTTRAREAIAILIENNVPKMEVWLQECYEQDGPKAALRVLIDLLEYNIPRLARTEHTGLDGAAIRVVASQED